MGGVVDSNAAAANLQVETAGWLTTNFKPPLCVVMMCITFLSNLFKFRCDWSISEVRPNLRMIPLDPTNLFN